MSLQERALGLYFLFSIGEKKAQLSKQKSLIIVFTDVHNLLLLEGEYKVFQMTYLKKIKLNFFEVVHKSPSVISVSPPHSFVSFAGHCNPKLLAYNQRRRRHLTCHLKEVTERMGCSHLCFTRYRNDGLMTSPQQHKESTKRVLAEHTLNF